VEVSQTSNLRRLRIREEKKTEEEEATGQKYNSYSMGAAITTIIQHFYIVCRWIQKKQNEQKPQQSNNLSSMVSK